MEVKELEKQNIYLLKAIESIASIERDLLTGIDHPDLAAGYTLLIENSIRDFGGFAWNYRAATGRSVSDELRALIEEDQKANKITEQPKENK